MLYKRRKMKSNPRIINDRLPLAALSAIGEGSNTKNKIKIKAFGWPERETVQICVLLVIQPISATRLRIYQAVGYSPVAESIACVFQEKQPNRSL